MKGNWFAIWYLRGRELELSCQSTVWEGVRAERKTERGSRERWLLHWRSWRQMAERRKLDCNLKKPQLLVGTKPNCVSSHTIWRLASKTSPLAVVNKVVGSILIFEVLFDWSIRIPVVSMVYSQRWLIVSAGLKALFWALHPLCCSYFKP